MPPLTDSSLPLKIALTSPFSSVSFIFHCFGVPSLPYLSLGQGLQEYPLLPRAPEPEVRILELGRLSWLYFSVPLVASWSEA